MNRIRYTYSTLDLVLYRSANKQITIDIDMILFLFIS